LGDSFLSPPHCGEASDAVEAKAGAVAASANEASKPDTAMRDKCFIELTLGLEHGLSS